MKLGEARHAFITGGASGIGLGIADALAARGLRVTLADLDKLELSDVLLHRPAAFRSQDLDTRNRDAWLQAKTEAEAAFGPVDVLINNAGIAPTGHELADTDPASFDRILAINLTGVFNGIWAFAADMRSRGRGHIVNTASVAGLHAKTPGLGPYAVSKFGVVALSEQLRAELAPHNVGVSVLCPGYVQTNLQRNTQRIGGELRSDGSMTMPESSLIPRQIGDIVAAGIERNLAYVITHPESWAGVESRFEEIRSAFVGAAAFSESDSKPS